MNGSGAVNFQLWGTIYAVFEIYPGKSRIYLKLIYIFEFIIK
jgi:hypothetical protein